MCDVSSYTVWNMMFTICSFLNLFKWKFYFLMKNHFTSDGVVLCLKLWYQRSLNRDEADPFFFQTLISRTRNSLKSQKRTRFYIIYIYIYIYFFFQQSGFRWWRTNQTYWGVVFIQSAEAPPMAEWQSSNLVDVNGRVWFPVVHVNIAVRSFTWFATKLA